MRGPRPAEEARDHTLNRHVRSTRDDDLPARVVDVVKRAIVDNVGVGIAGSSAPMPTRLLLAVLFVTSALAMNL